jgi:dihydrofolate synthase/folylpolyglutamate synthase
MDGAHNADSARRLVQALEQYFAFERALLIFGASSDKNIAGMVDELISLFEVVIVTRSRHPRAVAPERLVSEFAKRGITPQVAEDVASALEMALARSRASDLICATGSLFLIAEVMEYMLGRG